MAYGVQDKTTCTACAGTLLLEFAALSRLTGNPEFEVSLPPCPLWGKLNLPPPLSHTQLKAHRAMEAIWQRRDHGHNLVGTTINIHNGEWTRRGETTSSLAREICLLCTCSYCSTPLTRPHPFTCPPHPHTHTHTCCTSTRYCYIPLFLFSSYPYPHTHTPTHPHTHVVLLHVIVTYLSSSSPPTHTHTLTHTHTHTPTHTHTDSGVGAGIDSYYEYCLKSYILLGNKEYLRRFNKVRGVAI